MLQTSKFPSLRSALTTTLLGSILTSLIGFVSSLIIARTLHPEGRGELALCLASIYLLQPLVSILSGGSDIIYGQEPSRKSQIVRLILLANAGFSFLTAVIFLIFPQARILVSGSAQIATAFVLPSVLFVHCVENDIRGLLAANQRFKLIMRTDVAVSAYYLIVCSVLAHFKLLTVTGALTIYGFGRLALVMIYLYCLRAVTVNEQTTVGSASIRTNEALSIGFRSFLASLPVLFLMRIDVWLLGIRSNLYEVGSYAVAAGLASQFTRLGSILGNILKGKSILQADIGRSAVKAMYLVAGCGVIGAFLASVFAQKIITRLYGAVYESAWQPFVVLTVAAIFWSTGNTISGLVCVKRRYPISASCGLAVALICNILLNLIWIPSHGALGSAAAALVAYAIASIVWIVEFRKAVGFTWRELYPF